VHDSNIVMLPFVIIFVMTIMSGRPPVNGRRTSSHLDSLIANVLQHRLRLVHHHHRIARFHHRASSPAHL